jgi:hypothetical protein
MVYGVPWSKLLGWNLSADRQILAIGTDKKFHFHKILGNDRVLRHINHSTNQPATRGTSKNFHFAKIYGKVGVKAMYLK